MLTDARNRMKSFALTYEGFILTGRAEIEPHLPADETSPAIPRSAEIVEIYIDGKPAADLLNPRVEQWVCEQLEKQA